MSLETRQAYKAPELIEVGDIVKAELAGEEAWLFVKGYHGKGALQAQIASPLDGESFHIGEYIKLERAKVLAVLEEIKEDDRVRPLRVSE